MMDLTTPVAFFAFNRPELTARVFERIREARPAHLLAVCDGPRPDRPEDMAKVAAVRAVLDQVDWPCRVQRNYADTNMGCRQRVASGLNWVFEQVEEAIILEDDTLPDPSFFPFCQELLERYRDDCRVMHISGDGRASLGCKFKESYAFSKYSLIWGWATWARAWAHYDAELSSWTNGNTKREVLQKLVLSEERGFWISLFDRMAKAPALQDTWDYQWVYTCMKIGGLSALPRTNLIQNIGFGADATHTHDSDLVINVSTKAMDMPIIHPKMIHSLSRLDKAVFENLIWRAKTSPTWMQAIRCARRFLRGS